jgi:uncharacterized repeat protein (TIGR01451 family)
MGHDLRRDATGTTRRSGVLRKSVAQLAVLGLVAGAALFALSASAGAILVPSNCQKEVYASSITLPFIQICKTGPASAVAGTDITYTLSPTSTVEEDAELVVLDTLPAGETLVGTPSGTGWDCSSSTSTQVTCFGNTVDSPGNDITVTVLIASDFPGDLLHNCAGMQLEAKGFAQGACWDTTVTRVADLAITKTGVVPAGSTKVGVNVAYEIDVTNNGPSMSDPVTVSDPLPAGTTLVSAGGTGWTCTGTTTVTCTHDPLDSGESASIAVTATVGSSLAGQNLQNCASITVGDTSDAHTNDEACADSVTVPVVVSPAKAVAASPAFTG